MMKPLRPEVFDLYGSCLQPEIFWKSYKKLTSQKYLTWRDGRGPKGLKSWHRNTWKLPAARNVLKVLRKVDFTEIPDMAPWPQAEMFEMFSGPRLTCSTLHHGHGPKGFKSCLHRNTEKFTAARNVLKVLRKVDFTEIPESFIPTTLEVNTWSYTHWRKFSPALLAQPTLTLASLHNNVVLIGLNLRQWPSIGLPSFQKSLSSIASPQ